MRKNSLSTKGLSLSQAQSISNLCNQRAKDIDMKLKSINNFSRTVVLQNGTEIKEVEGNPLPENVVDLILEKCKLHACQAFLMSNIKAKEQLLLQVKNDSLDMNELQDGLEYPKLTSADLENEVNEEYGWEQLSLTEMTEYIKVEAFASHIGQFIHRDGVLDSLRNELPKLKLLDWFEFNKNEKVPVKLEKHHTQEQLAELHEKLAIMHRDFEKKVNYYKAKVKNIVTLKNSEINKSNSMKLAEVETTNSNLMEDYRNKRRAILAEIEVAQKDFESKKNDRVKEIVSMRIEVSDEFKDTIDQFMVDEK